MILTKSLTSSKTGPSKRLAKTAAAKSALARLCNISYSPMQTAVIQQLAASEMLNVQNGTENDSNSCAELPQLLADGIGKYVIIWMGWMLWSGIV